MGLKRIKVKGRTADQPTVTSDPSFPPFQREAIPEMLKNMLLVVQTTQALQAAEGFTKLWGITGDRLDAFLPSLRHHVFRCHPPCEWPRPIKFCRLVEEGCGYLLINFGRVWSIVVARRSYYFTCFAFIQPASVLGLQNLVGWFREVVGTYRSMLVEFGQLW